MVEQLHAYIEVTADHIPYVADTWLNSFRSAPGVRDIPPDVYFPWMKRKIENCLLHAGVMVAVNSENTDDIVGCIVYLGKTLIYGYVRHGFRKEGHFKELCRRACPDGFTDYCFRSAAWDHPRGGLEYRPFFLPGGVNAFC